MDLRSGTPWWATLLIAVLTLLGGHWLTLHRERKKSEKDEIERWRAECGALISKVADSAIQHYFAAAAVPTTVLSATNINIDLKRLATLLRTYKCAESADSAEQNRLILRLRNEITLPVDFQDVNRVARPAADPLAGSIQLIEEALKAVLKRKRKLR